MAEADDFEEGDVVSYTDHRGKRLATIISISYEGMEAGDPPDIRICPVGMSAIATPNLF